MIQHSPISCILFRFFEPAPSYKVDAIYLRDVPAKTMTSQSWTPFPYIIQFCRLDISPLMARELLRFSSHATAHLFPTISNRVIVNGTVLFILHLLRKLRIMLLETIANALLRSHPLHNTAVNASVFAGRHSLGSKVVDA